MGAYDSWLQSLEDKVANLQAEVRDLLAKRGIMARDKQTRLAITAGGGRILEVVALDCDPGDGSSSSSSSSSGGGGNVFDIILVDASYPETVGLQAVTVKNRQATAAHVARCLDDSTPVPAPGILIEVFWHNGQWWYAGKAGLVGIKLAGTHPGQGVVFNVYLGTWNPDTADYDYDESTTYEAIDLRYGVVYPDYSTGLAQWQPYNG